MASAGFSLIFVKKGFTISRMCKIGILGFLFLVGCVVKPPIADKLIHQDQAAVRKMMGEPTVVRTEAPYQMWGWRSEECSTVVFFDETGVSQYVDFSGKCLK